MLDNPTLKSAIEKSPMSDDDKAHWIEIMSKLSESQRDRLVHSLTAKTDIAAAKAAINKALKIIDDAESEAEENMKDDEVKAKAKEELMKEIDANNPMMPKTGEVTSKSLEEQKQNADEELTKLRTELADISRDAHGAPPPSHVTPAKPVTPGEKMAVTN